MANVLRYKCIKVSVTDSFAKDWSRKRGVRSVNVTAEN